MGPDVSDGKFQSARKKISCGDRKENRKPAQSSNLQGKVISCLKDYELQNEDREISLKGKREQAYCVYVCVHAFVCVYTCLCVCVCMCVCVLLSAFVCVYICVYYSEDTDPSVFNQMNERNRNMYSVKDS